MLLIHVVVCGGLSYFRTFRRYIPIVANGSVWEVSQFSISVGTFNRLSFLVSIRNSYLVYIVRSFRCYFRPCIGRGNIATSHVVRDGICRLERLLRSDIIYLFI